MATELLPCPFCGSDEDMLSLRTHIDGGGVPGSVFYQSFSIGCNECYVSIGTFPSIEAVIAAWNRRTPLPPVDSAEDYIIGELTAMGYDPTAPADPAQSTDAAGSGERNCPECGGPE